MYCVPLSTQGAVSPPVASPQHRLTHSPHDSTPQSVQVEQVAWTNTEAQMTEAKWHTASQSVPDEARCGLQNPHADISCPQSSAHGYLLMELKEATEVK